MRQINPNRFQSLCCSMYVYDFVAIKLFDFDFDFDYLIFFCLPSIIVGYRSIRHHELVFQSIIPKFKMNASSLLKSRGRSAICGRSANVMEYLAS